MKKNFDSKVLVTCLKTNEGKFVPLEASVMFLRENGNGLQEVVLAECPVCKEEHVIATLGDKRYFQYLNRPVTVSKVTQPFLGECPKCLPNYRCCH